MIKAIVTFLLVSLSLIVQSQTISGSTTTCVGNNEGYTFYGPTGTTITSWQITGGTASGSGFSRMVNWTSATNYGQVRVNYKINGATQPYASLTVVVNPSSGLTAGSIGGAAATVCFNSSPGTIQNTASATGNGFASYYWYKRAISAPVFSGIAGANSATYTPPNLTESTYFYRVASFICGQRTSNTIYVEVRPQLFAGSISVPSPVCYNTSSINLSTVSNASGGDGNYVYTWQSSSDGINFSDLGGSNSASYTYNLPLTSSTYFRRRVVSCGTSTTNSFLVNVNPPLVVGSISSTSYQVCYGSGLDFGYTAPSGGDGSYTFQWSISNASTGWAYASISGATGVDYNPPSLTENSYFRRTDFSCGNSQNTNIIYITVDPTTQGGNVSASTSTACGTYSNTLYLNNNVGAVIRWERNYGSGWQAIASTNSSLPVSESSSLQFRAISKSGTCLEAASTPISITVLPNLIPGTIATPATQFCNVATIDFTNSMPTGGTNTYTHQWQSSTDQVNWSNISGATGADYNPAGLTASVYFRRMDYSCSQSQSTNILFIQVYPLQGGMIPSAETYGSYTGVLTLSGHAGAVQRWEKNSGSGWQIIANTSTTNSITGLAVTTQFKAIVKNGVCAEVPSATASVTIYPIPTVSTPLTTLAYARQTTLTCSSTYYNYKWYKDGIYVSTLVGKTPTIKEPGKYKVEVFGSATSPGYFSNEVTINSLGSQTANYISTVRIRKSGVTTSTNLYTLTPQEIAQSLEYQDGLGRPIQTLQVGQSPMSGDIVQPIAYDSYGMSPTTYLPYTTPSVSGIQRDSALLTPGNYTLSEQYKFYQGTYNAANAVKITTDVAPYAKTTYDNSPLFRVLESGAPGTDWQPGTTHTVRPVFRVNTAADNVKIWTVAGPATVAPLTYAAGLLGVAETTDENGNKVLTFSDKLGRTLLKRVQIDDTLEGTFTSFLETYYVYDDLGNLALQVPPKATAKINSGTAWSVAFRDQWCFVYTYDVRNRLVEKKVPDAAAVYYAYDRFDRLVLMQDGFLRNDSSKWMYVKYDVKGRPVMSGIYKNATHLTRSAIQINVLDPLYATGVWYEERASGTGLHGYTNQSFPMTHHGGATLRVFSVNYYDNYDFDNNGTPEHNYVAQGITGEGTQATTFGMPTGSKRLVLSPPGSPGAWLTDYVFYDKFSRVIQVRSNNHLSTAIDNLTTRVYDFEGKVLQTKTYHNGGGTNQVTVDNMFNYDDAGRLLKVFQSNNNAVNPQLLAQYEYNELGQVVDKKLHNTTGTTFLQSVDYRYNIRGWLTSINNAQLTTDARNDDTNDFFGMELAYNTVESGLSNAQYYNGNISAIKWKGAGMHYSGPLAENTDGQRSYKFTYDKSDRLTAATFAAKDNASNWNKQVNTLNETLTYDHNGNIKRLLRNQNQRSNSGITVTSAAQPLDSLTYTYTTGNQISKVEDSGLSAGFTNVNNPTEYIYNANGSLTKDDNKGIQTITYNELGKPWVITYSGTPTKTVQYTYDASGSKLKMVTTVGSTVTTTNYVGGFVYDGATPALSFFGSPEGRVIKNGSAFEYQYAVADHQGNTRVVFTSATPAPVATSTTMEAATDANFQNYTNRLDFNLMDHTDTGTTYKYAQKLTGGYNAQVGVAKSYKVYAGDKVKIEAWGKYTNPTSTGSNIAGFASALFAAFGVPAPVGGETGTISSALNIWGGLVAGGTGGNNPSGPKAFVNIIVFDKNYKYMDAAWDGISSAAHQVGATPVVPHEYMMQEYTVKEEGYVFMYVSNENATLVDMYFDDIVMTHTKSNVIQYNEYYPFGMQTANSWTRENTKGNNYLSNGGTELNTTTGVYDLHYRNYDPVLGRMNQVDPLADQYSSLSTYNFAFNDPVYWNDPLGDSPQDEINASRNYDMERNYANSYRTIGDDDMYGSMFNRSSFDWYGPGDGGALSNLSDYVVAGSHAAKFGRALASGNIFKIEAALDQFAEWDKYGGDEITREQWLLLGGDPTVFASQYFSGAYKYKKQVEPDAKFYYDALDGLKLNNGQILYRKDFDLTFNPSNVGNAQYLGFKNGKHYVNFDIESYEPTAGNIRALTIHEVYGHGIKRYGLTRETRDHHKAYFVTIDSQYWGGTTKAFKVHETYWMWRYYSYEVPGSINMPEPYTSIYLKYNK